MAEQHNRRWEKRFAGTEEKPVEMYAKDFDDSYYFAVHALDSCLTLNLMRLNGGWLYWQISKHSTQEDALAEMRLFVGTDTSRKELKLLLDRVVSNHNSEGLLQKISQIYDYPGKDSLPCVLWGLKTEFPLGLLLIYLTYCDYEKSESFLDQLQGKIELLPEVLAFIGNKEIGANSRFNLVRKLQVPIKLTKEVFELIREEGTDHRFNNPIEGVAFYLEKGLPCSQEILDLVVDPKYGNFSDGGVAGALLRKIRPEINPWFALEHGLYKSDLSPAVRSLLLSHALFPIPFEAKMLDCLGGLYSQISVALINQLPDVITDSDKVLRRSVSKTKMDFLVRVGLAMRIEEKELRDKLLLNLYEGNYEPDYCSLFERIRRYGGLIATSGFIGFVKRHEYSPDEVNQYMEWLLRLLPYPIYLDVRVVHLLSDAELPRRFRLDVVRRLADNQYLTLDILLFLCEDDLDDPYDAVRFDVLQKISNESIATERIVVGLLKFMRKKEWKSQVVKKLSARPGEPVTPAILDCLREEKIAASWRITIIRYLLKPKEVTDDIRAFLEDQKVDAEVRKSLAQALKR